MSISFMNTQQERPVPLGQHHLPGACHPEGAIRISQVWSWDITKLLGPVKWTYFYLYVILDIFSRYIVGWMVASRESTLLAEKLIHETCQKQGIQPGN
jgi:transposase InsO family protein